MITYEAIIEICFDKGYERGIEAGIEIPVINAFEKGHSVEQIVDFMDLSLEKVRFIVEKHLKSQVQNY